MSQNHGILAVLAAPRFGPTAHFMQTQAALFKCRIPCGHFIGCYWYHAMSELMEQCIESGAVFILTLDYDTIFRGEDVVELHRLMGENPHVDAVTAVQCKRYSETPLYSGAESSQGELTKIRTGHFGCTMIRAKSLNQVPRPWMVGRPNVDGRWGKGKRTPDMEFWDRWSDASKSLYLANRVVVGHMEEVIAWPDKEDKPVFQTTGEFERNGMPEGVKR